MSTPRKILGRFSIWRFYERLGCCTTDSLDNYRHRRGTHPARGAGNEMSAIMLMIILVGVIAAISEEWGIVLICLFLGSCAS